MAGSTKPKPTPDENAAALKELQIKHALLQKAEEFALDGCRTRQDRVDRLKKEGNVIRDRLMEVTLELERLRGYLAARRDAEPPVMVPAPRGEGFQTSSPKPWQPNAPRPWYHQ